MNDSYIVCGKDIPDGYLHIVCYRDKYFVMLYDSARCDDHCWFDCNFLTDALSYVSKEFKVKF